MVERTKFELMECPIARSLGWVGDRWSFLILRDAYQGLTKFDEFRRSLRVAPNILSRHLKLLSDNGMLQKTQYSNHAKRFEYVLTDKGKDYFSVIAAMMAWSNKYLTPDGPTIELMDKETGKVFQPRVINDRGEEVSLDNISVVPGPAASRFIHERFGMLSMLDERNRVQKKS